MTAQEFYPSNITPAQMAQLRAEFQRVGMAPAEAEEAAALLAATDAKLDQQRAAMRDVLATMDRILAHDADNQATLT